MKLPLLTTKEWFVWVGEGYCPLCHLDRRGVRITRGGKGRVPTGADTRLITPYTSYLLRGS